MARGLARRYSPPLSKLILIQQVLVLARCYKIFTTVMSSNNRLYEAMYALGGRGYGAVLCGLVRQSRHQWWWWRELSHKLKDEVGIGHSLSIGAMWRNVRDETRWEWSSSIPRLLPRNTKRWIFRLVERTIHLNITSLSTLFHVCSIVWYARERGSS